MPPHTQVNIMNADCQKCFESGYSHFNDDRELVCPDPCPSHEQVTGIKWEYRELEERIFLLTRDYIDDPDIRKAMASDIMCEVRKEIKLVLHRTLEEACNSI